MFLANGPTSITHVIQLLNPLNVNFPHIIPLKLQCVTRYFIVRKPLVHECEDEEIPKLHSTAEESPQGNDGHAKADKESHMLDFWGQVASHDIAVKGNVFACSI